MMIVSVALCPQVVCRLCPHLVPTFSADQDRLELVFANKIMLSFAV